MCCWVSDEDFKKKLSSLIYLFILHRLGEVCVHAASLLFAAAAHVKIMKNTPVTSLPNSWECRYTKQVNISLPITF